jgi:hypothetical protein
MHAMNGMKKEDVYEWKQSCDRRLRSGSEDYTLAKLCTEAERQDRLLLTILEAIEAPNPKPAPFTAALPSYQPVSATMPLHNKSRLTCPPILPNLPFFSCSCCGAD